MLQGLAFCFFCSILLVGPLKPNHKMNNLAPLAATLALTATAPFLILFSMEDNLKIAQCKRAGNHPPDYCMVKYLGR